MFKGIRMKTIFSLMPIATALLFWNCGELEEMHLKGSDGELCASDATWSHGEGDLQNTKRATGIRTKGCFYGPVDTPKVQWSIDLSGPGTAAAPVIAEDGTIYIMGEYPGQPKFGGIRNAGLFAINPNGTIKWFFSRPRENSLIYTRSVALAKDGTIYMNMWDSTLYALNPDGSVKWSHKKLLGSGPVVDDDGHIYVGSDTVFCFNSDGIEQWRFVNDSFIDYSASIILGRDHIFCSYYHNGIMCLDYVGKKKWFYPVYYDNIIHFGIIADEKDNIYFKSKYTNLQSLDRNGNLRWNYDVGGYSGGPLSEPVLRGDYLYFGNAFIKKVPLQSGIPDSIADLDGGNYIDFWSSLLVDDRGTIFGVSAHFVYAFAAAGLKLWRYDLPETYPSNFIGHLGLGHDGTLYVTSYNFIDPGQVNKLYAIR